jgi:ubiquinone/menaquinone biosynthesis C-methylase UbiE
MFEAFNRFLWDIYGVFYDVLFFSKPHKEMFDELVKELDVKTGDKILDAGSGSGNFLVSLRKKSLTVTAIDFSSVMLLLLKLKCYLLGVHRVKAYNEDLNKKIDLDSGSQDFTISINVAFGLNEPEEFIKELSRVTKVGGSVCVIVPTEDFSIVKIARLHVSMLKKSGFLGYVTLFIESIAFLIPVIFIGLINLIFEKFMSSGSYKVFSHKEVVDMFERENLSVVSSYKACAEQEYVTIGQRR